MPNHLKAFTVANYAIHKNGTHCGSNITQTSAKQCLKHNLANTHYVHYMQYTVFGLSYAVGNEVAALSNIYSGNKTLHEYLT